MLDKYGCTMPEVLRDIANGVELTPWRVKFIQEQVAKYDERCKKQAEQRKKARESFEREIMEILERSPCTGFTATDIQFNIRDFVNRRITNQKVANYLRGLAKDGKITRKYLKTRKTVFFCGDNLVDICGGGINLYFE